MIPYIFGFIAALAAVSYEAFAKANPGASWLALVLPVGLICALTTNYGIYRILHSGESILGGLVVFSLFTAALRVGWTLSQGHKVSTSVWVAFSLVLVASVLKQVWR